MPMKPEIYKMEGQHAMQTNEYKSGTLAYIDSLAGLIPCKVISVNGSNITVKITVNFKAWVRGGIIHCTKDHDIVPRKQVYTRYGHYMIRSNYKWIS